MWPFSKKSDAKNDESVKTLETATKIDEQDQESETIKTTLSYHPGEMISAQEKYVYQFYHEQLPPLMKNQISIFGMDVIKFEDGIVIDAFIRQTLSKAVRIEEASILLLDSEKRLLAKKTFNLAHLDEIPSNSCRPCKFLFEKDELMASIEQIQETGWSLAFEIPKRSDTPHQLVFDEGWENGLSIEQKEELVNLNRELPPPAIGEVNLFGVKAAITSEGLSVTLLIRNGTPKDITFQQLPLSVEDAAGETIAAGSFQLSHFQVSGHTSKPWTFIFPQSLMQKENPDLSKWSVSVLQ